MNKTMVLNINRLMTIGNNLKQKLVYNSVYNLSTNWCYVNNVVTTRRVLCILLIGLVYFIARSVMSKHAYGLKRTPHQHWITLQKKSVITCDRNPMDWIDQKFTACGGHFTGYGRQFAVLTNVIVVPNNTLFYIPCKRADIPIQYTFEAHGINDLNDFIKNVKATEEAHGNELLQAVNGASLERKAGRTVFAVARDAARGNLWHTMTEWYNAFLICKMLNIDINTVDILAYETYTEVGIFDHGWTTLFDKLEYPKDVKDARLITRMVWNIQNYMSPLEFFCMSKLPPFFEGFKEFILQKYNLTQPKILDCRNLTIFFLWRKDYKGVSFHEDRIMSRKIMNIDELVDKIKQDFPSATVIKETMESMNFVEQIKTFTQLDIVISPHGAGLTHMLFLPSHAGVVEIFPTYTQQFPDAQHYKNLAKYRQLHYLSWNNHNPDNEYPQFNTYVPPLGIQARVQQLYDRMCSTTRYTNQSPTTV